MGKRQAHRDKGRERAWDGRGSGRREEERITWRHACVGSLTHTLLNTEPNTLQRVKLRGDHVSDPTLSVERHTRTGLAPRMRIQVWWSCWGNIHGGVTLLGRSQCTDTSRGGLLHVALTPHSLPACAPSPCFLPPSLVCEQLITLVQQEASPARARGGAHAGGGGDSGGGGESGGADDWSDAGGVAEGVGVGSERVVAASGGGSASVPSASARPVGLLSRSCSSFSASSFCARHKCKAWHPAAL